MIIIFGLVIAKLGQADLVPSAPVSIFLQKDNRETFKGDYIENMESLWRHYGETMEKLRRDYGVETMEERLLKDY